MSKRFHFYPNLSVSLKFVLTYLSLFAVALTSTGVYLYMQASNSAVEQAQLVMEHNLQQTKENVLQQIKIMEKLSQIISYDNKLQSFLERGFTNDIYNIEDYLGSIRPFVENIMRQNSNIHAIRIYMTNPTIPELYDSFYKIDRVSDEDWYKESIGDPLRKKGWLSLHESPEWGLRPANQTDVFSMYRKITSITSSDLVGVLEMEVKESSLFQVLRDPLASELGQVFVIDRNNRIVSNNIPALYRQQSGLVDLFHPDTVVNRIEKVDGKRQIVISVPIQELGCSIAGVFPVDRFIVKVKNSVGPMVLVLTATLVVLGMIIYIVTHALLRRIKRLVKAMKQVQEGSLDISVPVISNDEFTQLAITFNHMTSRIYGLVETVYKNRLMEKEAELKALEAQVNPHFLYNTLATITWVARRDKSAEIVNLANALAKFYRLVLSKGSTFISVKDEVDMIKTYLQIQKFRFESAFDVIYDIDEEMHNYRIVKNLLQPIVENSLIHGIEPKRSHGTIRIVGRIEGERLVFRMIDDGVGMRQETLLEILSGQLDRSIGSGYAMKNIRDRLEGYYGEMHDFHIFSRLGIGTVITLSVDKEAQGG